MADEARPLNKRGRRAAAAVGRWLADQGIHPSLVLCSTARRSRETLELIHDAFGAKVPIQLEPGLYLADAASLLARLQRLPRDVPSVLLIGHNPGLHELAGELAHAEGAAASEVRERLDKKFPTAALGRFRLKIDDWKSLSPDAPAGIIKFLGMITPKELGKD